jgi:flagella basal body P-ring formation protein FlgA
VLGRESRGLCAPLARASGLACALLAALAGSARAGAVDAGAPVRIELRPEAEVRGPQVLLGDVANLETRDLTLLERLMSVPLGPAPRTGAPARLEREQLQRWIHARTGIAPDQVVWAGPEVTTVRLALTTVSGEQIVEAARRALPATADRDGSRAAMVPNRVPPDVTVPAGAVEVAARPVRRTAVLSRRPTVWVDVRVDGRFVRTVPVAFEPAILDSDPGAAAAPEAAETASPRGPAAAGAAIARAPAEALPSVTRGSWVTLRVGSGRIAVESRVQVLEDGRAGQAVRVKLPSARVIVARVAGPDRVEVVQ